MKRQDPLDADLGSATSPPVAPDSGARDAQDDDGEPSGYWIGECGHRVYGGPIFRISSGPCDECESGVT